MSTTRIMSGKKGEQIVAEYLMQRDYAIIARNYRKRCGEIDIIATLNHVIAFVEVKFRINPYIDSAEIIGYSKQKSIITIAKQFLSTHTETDVICRFDVALVEENNHILTVRYISNAFTDFD